MKPHILWGFIWIQIVCKGHQWSSKFTASMLRVKQTAIIHDLTVLNSLLFNGKWSKSLGVNAPFFIAFSMVTFLNFHKCVKIIVSHLDKGLIICFVFVNYRPWFCLLTMILLVQDSLCLWVKKNVYKNVYENIFGRQISWLQDI